MVYLLKHTSTTERKRQDLSLIHILLNGYLYIPYDLKTLLIIAIALDLIFVIIGSQFWKKANHINPPSEKNKVWFFLCSQMGLIVAVIAFCPLIVLLLKNKDKLDKKTKVIVTVIAAVALLVAGACSIDYDPVSQESLAEAKSEEIGRASCRERV